MNILMLVDDLNIGGTATHILSISKALNKIGFNVLIVASCGELESKFKESNLEVIYLNFYEDLNTICNNILDIVYLYNIDLIHAHLPKSIEICNNIKKNGTINYIVTLHGLFYEKRILKLCENASEIICVSEPVKELLLKNIDNIDYEKVNVIYNFIEPLKSFYSNVRNELNISKYSKIVTYCSRLSNCKGLLAERFLHEFHNIAKKRNDVYAVILGDGIRKRVIDFYAKSINEDLKRKAIFVLGSVFNPCDYFIESNCVIGTGRVAIEALNANVGCVAVGSKGYVGIIEPKSYKDMIESYFGEHKIINSTEYTFGESIEIVLDNNLSLETISLNKFWCNEIFNEELSIIRLTNIYKEAKLQIRDS